MNVYVLGFVVAATAGAVGYVICIRTGGIGCLLVALAPLAFVLALAPIACGCRKLRFAPLPIDEERPGSLPGV